MRLQIGMVGIGPMGHSIAGNLLRHGHELAVFEHAGNQPIDDLVARGAVVLDNLKALAARPRSCSWCLAIRPKRRRRAAGRRRRSPNPSRSSAAIRAVRRSASNTREGRR